MTDEKKQFTDEELEAVAPGPLRCQGAYRDLEELEAQGFEIRYPQGVAVRALEVPDGEEPEFEHVPLRVGCGADVRAAVLESEVETGPGTAACPACGNEFTFNRVPAEDLEEE